MRFYVICIGKLKDAYLRDGVAEFVKRMRPYGGITITELNESKIGDKPSDADRKQVVIEEGERFIKKMFLRMLIQCYSMCTVKRCPRKTWQRLWQN